MTQPENRLQQAALSTLIILQLVMLFALFSQTAPHPPLAVAPFGIAPFLAAALAFAASGLILGTQHPLGRPAALLAALCALVSYGPQKYFDAQFALIWPSVLLGQAAVLVVFADQLSHLRNRNAPGIGVQ